MRVNRSWTLMAVPLWMSFGTAAAGLEDPHVCYILDGILFLYGFILTGLYCSIKIGNRRKAEAGKVKAKPVPEESIYHGLAPHAQDTYETIGMKK